MVDDRTHNLALPLPHRANDLADDVERLRQALTALDASLCAVSTELHNPKSGLPSLTAALDDMRGQLAELQRLLPAKADIADLERFQAAVRRDVPVGMAATLRRLKLNAQLGLGI